MSDTFASMGTHISQIKGCEELAEIAPYYGGESYIDSESG